MKENIKTETIDLYIDEIVKRDRYVTYYNRNHLFSIISSMVCINRGRNIFSEKVIIVIPYDFYFADCNKDALNISKFFPVIEKSDIGSSCVELGMFMGCTSYISKKTEGIHHIYIAFVSNEELALHDYKKIIFYSGE